MQAMGTFATHQMTPAQAQRQLAPLWQERNQAITEIAARYVSHPWSIDFLVIVSPLVMWIWLGALIIAAGGLIALWPIPAMARRRVAVPRERPAAPLPPPPVPVREPV